MGNAKLLMDVADKLRGLADSLAAMAGATIEGNDQQTAEPPAPTITLEQVRAVLADRSRLGKTDAVKELLGRFGADRLSAVEPTRFAELL